MTNDNYTSWLHHFGETVFAQLTRADSAEEQNRESVRNAECEDHLRTEEEDPTFEVLPKVIRDQLGLLTPAEAAEFVGHTEGFLALSRAEGEGAPFYHIDCRIYYARIDLLKWRYDMQVSDARVRKNARQSVAVDLARELNLDS